MTTHPGRSTTVLTACAAAVIAWPLASTAHHSTAEYDSDAFAEARGEIVSVLWRNPHVRLRISTEAFDGNSELWELEGTDLTRLDRYGLPHDLVAVGDVVNFAGNPSTRSDRRMYVTNILLTDGREIMLRGNTQARWAPDRLIDVYAPGGPPSDAAAAATAAAAVTSGDNRDIFDKVYVPTRGPRPDWLNNPPLTDQAREKRALYDAVLDDPVLGCVSPGMPRVLTRSGPYAIRFLERDGDIIQQNEWFEVDRLIHMDGQPPPADQAHTPLGYSAGRWMGDTLEITTTHIDWPYFQLYGLEGVPQSRDMTIVERFTSTEGANVVTYDLSATDPATFTETITYPAYVTFRWNPSLEFLPYDCIEEDRQARPPR